MSMNREIDAKNKLDAYIDRTYNLKDTIGILTGRGNDEKSTGK